MDSTKRQNWLKQKEEKKQHTPRKPELRSRQYQRNNLPRALNKIHSQVTICPKAISC